MAGLEGIRCLTCTSSASFGITTKQTAAAFYKVDATASTGKRERESVCVCACVVCVCVLCVCAFLTDTETHTQTNRQTQTHPYLPLSPTTTTRLICDGICVPLCGNTAVLAASSSHPSPLALSRLHARRHRWCAVGAGGVVDGGNHLAARQHPCRCPRRGKSEQWWLLCVCVCLCACVRACVCVCVCVRVCA